MIHRCQLPDRLTAPARVWSCPECDATHIWPRRATGRKANEGSYLNGLHPARMFGIAVILIVALSVGVAIGLPLVTVAAGLIVWTVLRTTS